jgi:hypothetical protein
MRIDIFDEPMEMSREGVASRFGAVASDNDCGRKRSEVEPKLAS